MLVASVVVIHRDGGVAEHSLRTRSGHSDEFIRANHRVANLINLAKNFLVLDLEIGDGSAAAGAPVDDVLPSINQAFFVEADEDFAHGTGKILVHGEVFAIPI